MRVELAGMSTPAGRAPNKALGASPSPTNRPTDPMVSKISSLDYSTSTEKTMESIKTHCPHLYHRLSHLEPPLRRQLRAPHQRLRQLPYQVARI